MAGKALVTAEIETSLIGQIEAFGYEVVLNGWGQTRTALTEDELVQLMPGVGLLMVEVENVTERIIAASEDLEIIHVCRSQPSNVDVEAASKRGIAVLSAPGRNAESVADFTIGVLLSLVRNLHRAERHLRETGWFVGEEIPYFHFRGPELAGKTLGLVGCGAIGREILQRMSGFDMEILIYDPYLPADDAQSLGRPVALDSLMSDSDFILVLCALTPETKSMIGTNQLTQMKPGAYLINTARAAVVEEGALFEVLQEGRIAGAALDVFWSEPLSNDSPWFKLDNVLLTPHLGGAAEDVRRHHTKMMIDDLALLREGRVPSRLANPEVLEKKIVKE